MKRLAYIDWMRGLACVLMFQTHCYDSWMSPEAKKSSSLIGWSRLGGTLPAPLFIFLAGVSFALVTEKLREKGIGRNAIARQTIWRGAEIFGMGLLFRVQEFALGYPWSPWTDLLRVDVLNILGLSMMLMGVLCWATGEGDAAAARVRTLVAGVFAAVIVAMVTPPLWTTHRPKFLPWPIESYINGVHIFKEPQPWLFPLFPWSTFAFAGLAVGIFLFSDFARRREGLAFAGAHNVEKMAGQGFTEESCGNCSARGILMITSPGLARPSSSRAIFSILRGSVFSSLTSCSSRRFSLFNCSRSVVAFLISSCFRRMAKKPCVPKMSCTRRTSTSSARSARPCWRRKSGMFSPGLVFFSFAEPIVMRLASILRKRWRFRLRRTGEAAAPCRK